MMSHAIYLATRCPSLARVMLSTVLTSLLWRRHLRTSLIYRSESVLFSPREIWCMQLGKLIIMS